MGIERVIGSIFLFYFFPISRPEGPKKSNKDRKEMEMEDDGVPEFGIIMGRFIGPNSPISGELTQRCWKSIRASLPADIPIVIVDDHSKGPDPYANDPARMSDRHLKMVTTELEAGKGEFGLYWYFWTQRPFRRALIVHDSMHFNETLAGDALHNVWTVPFVEGQSVRMLWHFPRNRYDPPYIPDLLAELPDRAAALEMLRMYQKRQFAACFGMSTLIDWDFLDSVLVHRYDWFSLLKVVRVRLDREAMERVMGLILCHHFFSVVGWDPEKGLERICLYGPIMEHENAFDLENKIPFERRLASKALRDRYPVWKTWHGR